MHHLYLFFIGLGFIPYSQSSTVAQGEHLYQSCVGCHSPSYNRTGPKHCFLFGRKVGTQKNYRYSKAMIESDWVWNEETLNRFLEDPRKAIPATKMTVVGIKNQTQRIAIIAYLKTLDQHSEECEGLHDDR
ncbi:c-type cytochrome [Vibrio penaeicida]|uniref:c-type cytochrome n=1 Tax=Vibrio penaeicida TaxID=104609 RepID=UPI000CE9CD9E|nr:c-type cytochrome [Vibrio penaeicida]